MANKNYKIILAYDGSNYLGWQKTSLGPSIEQCLQEALETILQNKVVLQAASRTDAGVHANGQVVNFFSTKALCSEEINAILPKDIRILSLEEAQVEFHPTLDCIGKTYHYDICYGAIQLPHRRFYSWHIPDTLDLAAMMEASKSLIGIHDFSAFCNVKNNEEYENKVRHLQNIEFESTSNHLRIGLTGKNFLYKMVRNIVGTLAYVGVGKIESTAVPIILKSCDRTQAGITAPAHGLCLSTVHY